MKVEIVYESKTGNTKLIAESIKNSLEETDNTVILQSVEEALKNDSKNTDVDLYFLGSWTNKGDCGEGMSKFAKGLNNKKIFLFGTAGFGGTEKYYEVLAERFSAKFSENNKVLGFFYCQGKMPSSIRDRYVSLLTKNTEDKKLEVSIENFDKAQSHPDKSDIEQAKNFAKICLQRFRRI